MNAQSVPKSLSLCLRANGFPASWPIASLTCLPTAQGPSFPCWAPREASGGARGWTLGGRLHPLVLFYKNQNTQQRASQQGKGQRVVKEGLGLQNNNRSIHRALGCSLVPEELTHSSWEPQEGDARVQGSNFGLQLPSLHLGSQPGPTEGNDPESQRP